MANVLVFGGTGVVGRRVVGAARERGHRVTVFSRQRDAAPDADEHLRTVSGNVMNQDDVRAALDGHDAVIQAVGVGGRPQAPTTVFSDATKVLVEQMAAGPVRRLICISNVGVGDSKRLIPLPVRALVFPILLRWLTYILADKERMEAIVTTSDLDWVVVRLPRLEEKPATGDVRVSYEGKIGRTMTFADAARFVVAQLEDTTYLRKTPAVSN